MKKSLICFSALIAFFAFGQSVSAQSATLYFVPATQAVQPGAVFTVTVMVNTGTEQANAAAANFSYPENLLEATQIDTTGSILGIPAPDNAAGAGIVRFSGGKIPPPFSGVQKLFSVVFRAKNSPGVSSLAFTSDSTVLTHGESKPILSLANSGGATIQIVAGSSPSPTFSPRPTATPSPTTTSSPTSVPELSISDIQAEILSQENVRLSWKTSEKTKSQVNYGFRSEGDYSFFILDGMLATEHSFMLSDIKRPADYALEIVGVDEFGNEVRTDRLLLSELVREEKQFSGVPEIVEREFEIGGVTIRFSAFLMFVLLPVLIFLLVAFVFFRYMRSRSKR